MTELEAQIETLDAQISNREMALARCGDAWLSRVAREDITSMRAKRRALIQQQQGAMR